VPTPTASEVAQAVEPLVRIVYDGDTMQTPGLRRAPGGRFDGLDLVPPWRVLVPSGGVQLGTAPEPAG